MSDSRTHSQPGTSATPGAVWTQYTLTAQVEADPTTTRIVRGAAGFGSWSGRGPTTTVVYPSALKGVKAALREAGVTVVQAVAP